jgi:hypothetical protein
VYSDSRVAVQIILGKTFSKLLQLVSLEGHNGDIIQMEFQHPLMHNITAKEINAIDAEIRSLDGCFGPGRKKRSEVSKFDPRTKAATTFRPAVFDRTTAVEQTRSRFARI